MTQSLSDIGHKSGNPIDAAKGIIPAETIAKLSEAGGTPPAAQPGAQPNAPAQQNTTPVVEVKSPFGNHTFGNPTQPNNQPVNIQNLTDVFALVTSSTGIEVKSVEDMVSKVFTPLKTLREQVTELPKIQAKVATLEDFITTLPADLSQVMGAYVSKGNYQAVMENIITAKTIDFNKDFRDHDEVQIVNHFLKGGYTKETFDALDPQIQGSLKAHAKMLYDNTKATFAAKPNIKEVTDARNADYFASVDSAITTLKAQYPDMSPDKLEEVKSLMLTKGFAKRLFNQDGMYKPTAAVEISTMLYGQEAIAAHTMTINQLMERATNVGYTQAVEQTLFRSDAPSAATRGGGGAGTPSQNVAEVVKKSTSFLQPGGVGEKF